MQLKIAQPPPRGCVLKQSISVVTMRPISAAASARLCVETFYLPENGIKRAAAAFVRLCVETIAQRYGCAK